MNNEIKPLPREPAIKLRRALKITFGWRFGALAFRGSLGALFLAGYWAWAQNAPVLKIAPAGTSQVSITVTNGVNSVAYDLYTTPVLANTVVYPWKDLTNGLIGQTNFTLNRGPFLTGYYEVLVDTNDIWKDADPNNPALGVLQVFIDSPTNGSNLTQ